MAPEEPKVRRAVVDDIPQLIQLWKSENLKWEILEKRFTEFQVVIDSKNTILGAIGLHIVGHEALMHSEVFLHFDMADTIRDLIWKRLEVIAHNHGLIRIWTLETSPYWHHNGFNLATPEQKQKFPTAFGDPNQDWYVIQLRSETPVKVTVPEKEFEVLLAQERQSTERINTLGKIMRLVATLLAAILLIGVVVGAIYIIRKLPPLK
jgi:N-acetylglutamate synthase-like GNAT family acetyltransferase